MAYENLLKSVEENEQDRERELREKAQQVVQELQAKTKKRGDTIRKALLEAAVKKTMVEKNQAMYLTKAENKERVISIKEKAFSDAFLRAQHPLLLVREDPRYPDIFKKLAREAVEGLGLQELLVHVDKRDEQLGSRVMAELKLPGKITTDITCAGGLVVTSPDGTIVFSNTIESRIERGKERLKLEIYSLLFGD